MPYSLFLRCGLVLALLWAAVGRTAAAADEPPAAAITPSQAGEVLQLLRDDKRRAQLEETLSVIAGAAPPADAAPAEPPAEAPVALTRGGVLARVFDQAGRWADSIGSELSASAGTVLELPSISAWWRARLGTPEARRAALAASWAVAAILVLAAAAEWLAWRILRRPRAALLQAAVRSHAHEETRQHAAAVPVPADAGAAQPATPARSARGLLRRVPYVLANAVLELLPLLAFMVVATALLTAWGGTRAPFYEVLADLSGAYIAVRLWLTAVRVLIHPAGPALRLTRLSDSMARYLYRWARRVVLTALGGTALADVALDLGATPEARNTLYKLVAIAVHAMLIAVVLQTRGPMREWIRGGAERGMSPRSLAADVWPFAAVFLLAALCVIWTLGVADGFRQLMHFFTLTAVIVLAAAVVSILALGALERLFAGSADDSTPAARSYYRVLVERTVSALIVIGALIALFQAWGLNALGWFEAGSIGRSVASAAVTIAVACALAIGAWESANLAMARRVDRWTREGDLLRATRLRTLLPILRTVLFIVIALVVLFTALNEVGVNIAPLLAGASIIGVALGFGSQKLVQDFITGIFLLMENAMQVGDFVTLAGVSGSVEYLSIRTVRLRAGDGSLHVVPFSSVGTVNNTNKGLGNASVRVSVRADADIDQVMAAIVQVGAEMRQDPALRDLILADLELWGVDQVDGAAVTLAGQIRTLDRGRWPVQRSFNQRLLRRFRELGIPFANPQERALLRTPRVCERPQGPGRRHDPHTETSD
ncbi:mechanosensitive ion channel [Pigmentiphaga soli]|uniref:Mechanosensitive ion channel n=1 Tax=Pigmentiphaga soli TaxID=1007095 RepID=A0ABP8GMI2_9BURK